MKKKPSFKAIEQHVLAWSLDRINDAKIAEKDFISSDIYKKRTDYERQVFFDCLIEEIVQIFTLLKPFNFEDEPLVEWAQDFILEYSDIDEDSEFFVN